MKTKQDISRLLFAMGLLLLAASPSFAHHSRAMFGVAQSVTYRLLFYARKDGKRLYRAQHRYALEVE